MNSILKVGDTAYCVFRTVKSSDKNRLLNGFVEMLAEPHPIKVTVLNFTGTETATTKNIEITYRFDDEWIDSSNKHPAVSVREDMLALNGIFLTKEKAEEYIYVPALKCFLHGRYKSLQLFTRHRQVKLPK